MLLGLLSTCREGTLAQVAAQSLLTACDHVVVLDAPFGKAPTGGDPTDLGKLTKNGHLTYLAGMKPFADDAAKRTHLVHWAQKRFTERPLWGMWLDADEVLVWPEHLRAWLNGMPEDAGGLPIPLVELSGATVYARSRLIRLDWIERYLVGSYQVQLITSPVPIALPNMPPPPPPEVEEITRLLETTAWDFGGAAQLALALGQVLELLKRVPPVSGTPHILHLAPLRAENRAGHRVHRDELAWVEKSTREMGIDPAVLGLLKP